MADDDARKEPPFSADERAMLENWLDFHRATLLLKCQGLSGEQLTLASVPPSTLTLLGLVQHMTLVEWWWFERVFADNGQPEPFDTNGNPEYEFEVLVAERAEQALEQFTVYCQRARAAIAEASLDDLSKSTERETRQLRWIMVHMIEEYARHNGHADLIRECIDGTVGD
jgi:hypothetical protein